MFKGLNLRNYRAFRSLDLDFARVNIFVGPNNSGKSSILSAINVIAQTLQDNDSGAPLILRGKYEDLGTYQDVVYGNRSNNPITLGFSIDNFMYSVEFKYRTQRKEIEISKYHIFESGKNLYSFQSRKDAYDLYYRGRIFENVFGGSRKLRPFFRGIIAFDRNISDISRSVRLEKEKQFEFLSLDASQIQNIERSMRRSSSTLRMAFSRFDALSSFRQPPQRTYLYSGVSPPSIGKTGDNTIEMLVSDRFRRGRARFDILERASAWFRTTNMAREIRVKTLTPRHFEICLLGIDGKEHNISDVGFGVSQVLPVLVGGLRLTGDLELGQVIYGNPLYVVQEPEIHLHPGAQADIASFFIELAKIGGQYFIETHSDTFIIRLQQHVALGDFPCDSVRVFYVYDSEEGKRVVQLDLDEKGMFTKDWPEGFFPQRQRESLALARAHLRRGEKKPSLFDLDD